MSKDEEIDLANLKIVIRFVKKDFSRYTLFIPLFKFSKVFLQLENKFSRYLKLNYKSKRYPVPKIANLGISLVCCGIDRFVRTDDEFRVEKGLAKSLGFSRGFPTSDTLYRFFKSFNGYNIRQLEKVNLEVLKEQHWFPRTGPVFIDLDMNTKSVEGKQIEKAMLGYNRKSPGRLCLNWTVGHIAKVALYSELHSGKTSGRTVLTKQVEHLEKLIITLDLDSRNPRFVWRVDGGYFSGANLKFLSERKFIMRVPKNLKVLKPALRRKDLTWRKYGKHSKYADAGNIEFPEQGIDLRLVLVKTYRKKKTLIYPLAGNLFDWKARSVVKAYRGRQIVENCFRDTNQAFYSSKLPSGSFHGNQAFLWFICLAYNLFFFFQKSDQGQTFGEIDTQETFPKVSQKSRRSKVPKKAATTGNIGR